MKVPTWSIRYNANHERKMHYAKPVARFSYDFYTRETIVRPNLYFKHIHSHCQSRMLCWCPRCGIKIGKVAKELINYNNIWICEHCYNDKLNGSKNTPDIEDISSETLIWLREESSKINNRLLDFKS